MDTYEATRIVFSRIQSLDPDNAAKIMGLLLIQEHGEKELIRLAFGPESLLHSVIARAKKDLGISISISIPPPPPPPSPPYLSRFTHPPPLTITSPSWAPPDDDDETDVDVPTYNDLSNHRRSFSAAAASDLCLSPDGGGWKPCLYFARGFCKNGSTCRFLHEDFGFSNEQQLQQPEQQQQHNDFLLRSKSPRQLAANAFPYSPTATSSAKCMNYLLQQQQQHSDGQRY